MKPISSVMSSSTCRVAGIHVASVRTFSESEEKVTLFSGLTLNLQRPGMQSPSGW